MKTKIDWNDKTIVISRVDSIGDVLLTLPLSAWLKQHFPMCKIVFLCRNYTKQIVESYQSVDEAIAFEYLDQFPKIQRVSILQSMKIDAVIHVFPKKELAQLFKQAKIPFRIGTSHRGFHFLTCNIRPNFTRKRSVLHESQLNFELLRSFGLLELPTLEELNLWTNQFCPPPIDLPKVIQEQLNKPFFCLHPKSQGSAKEWPIESYIELAKRLIELNYQVCFTGTEDEGKRFRDQLLDSPNCIDTSGKLSLPELLQLIRLSEGLVACSTGPLHISGFLNKKAVGLYSPKRPIHPGRWKPLGEQSQALVFDEDCSLCANRKQCNCIEQITIEQVLLALNLSA